MAELSHQICLSPSYFQNLYKKYFNVTCKTDIIHARIEYAKHVPGSPPPSTVLLFLIIITVRILT
nr:hypothetical protein [uncultured Mediterraneibacter sp.]